MKHYCYYEDGKTYLLSIDHEKKVFSVSSLVGTLQGGTKYVEIDITAYTDQIRKINRDYQCVDTGLDTLEEFTRKESDAVKQFKRLKKRLKLRVQGIEYRCEKCADRFGCPAAYSGVVYPCPHIKKECENGTLASPKRGHWENIQEGELYSPEDRITIPRTTQTCSFCKRRIGFIGSKLHLSDGYCPSCGAIMDEECED